MAVWHYAKGQQQYGPIPEEDFRTLIASGTVQPGDLIWSPGLLEWRPARTFPELFPADMSYAPPPVPLKDPNVANTKLAAGLCGILVGGFGVHKFVLGMTTPAIIMLIVSLVGSFPTCGATYLVMHVIGMAEGIIYLLKSDEEFHQTYMVEKKEWF